MLFIIEAIHKLIKWVQDMNTRMLMFIPYILVQNYIGEYLIVVRHYNTQIIHNDLFDLKKDLNIFGFIHDF